VRSGEWRLGEWCGRVGESRWCEVLRGRFEVLWLGVLWLGERVLRAGEGSRGARLGERCLREDEARLGERWLREDEARLGERRLREDEESRGARLGDRCVWGCCLGELR